MGYGRLTKIVQGKNTLNKNQILPCQGWWHGLLFFLRRFLKLVLLLMLYHSGKIAIPRYHMFLLLQILHLVLFKLLQLKAAWVSLEISVLSSGVLETEISAYHSWRELIYHLFGTDLLRSIFDLFPSVSFEKLFSLCCINAEMIASLSLASEKLSIYQAVPMTL